MTLSYDTKLCHPLFGILSVGSQLLVAEPNFLSILTITRDLIFAKFSFIMLFDCLSICIPLDTLTVINILHVIY